MRAVTRRAAVAAVWCAAAAMAFFLFRAAAALPADGYGLRFDAPLTAPALDAAFAAAESEGITAAFWGETTGTAAAGGRSAEARGIAAAGQPDLCCPARYLAGSAPGAGQTGGCGVSGALADALWGSRDAVGKALTWDDGPTLTVTGVFEGKTAVLLYPTDPDAFAPGYTFAALRGVPLDDPRGTARRFCQAAALPAPAAYQPLGTLRWLLNLVGWLPLAGAALRLCTALLRAARLGRGEARLLAFGAAVAFGLALPALLGALPAWIIPSRWSDFSFWRTLADTAADGLKSLAAGWG